jgi:hypothetical protein
VLLPAGSPLGLIAVRIELLRDVVIEAAQELRLPVPPVVNSPLEFHIALERQTLLDLRVFHPRILGAFARPLEYLVNPASLLP